MCKEMRPALFLIIGLCLAEAQVGPIVGIPGRNGGRGGCYDLNFCRQSGSVRTGIGY